MPALEFDFRIAVSLSPELSRSENRVHKEIITVTSGKWSGTFGNGRVLVRFFFLPCTFAHFFCGTLDFARDPV